MTSKWYNEQGKQITLAELLDEAMATVEEGRKKQEAEKRSLVAKILKLLRREK